MKPFKIFWPSAEIRTGVQFSPGKIRIAQIETGPKGSQVRFAGVEEIPEDATDEQINSGLRRLLQKVPRPLGIRAVCLPRSWVTLRRLRLPQGTPKEIAEMAALQAGTLLPYPVSEVVFDFQLLSQGTDHAEVLLALAHSGSLHQLGRWLKGSGIEWDAVLLSSCALVNLWKALRASPQETETNDVQCMLYLEEKGAEWVILENGRLAFSRVVPELEMTGRPEALSRLAEECRWTFKAYHNQHRGEAPRKLFLLGDLPGLDAAASALEEELKLAASVLPLPQAEKAAAESDSVCIPLGCVLGPEILDLLPAAERRRRTQTHVWRKVRGTAALAGVFCVLIAAMLASDQWVKRRELGLLEQELIRLRPEVARIRQAQKEAQRFEELAGTGPSVLETLRAMGEKAPQGIQMDRFAYQRNREVIVKGMSQDMTQLASYVGALEAEKLFDKVDIRYASRRILRDGREVADFELVCSLPPDKKKKR